MAVSAATEAGRLQSFIGTGVVFCDAGLRSPSVASGKRSAAPTPKGDVVADDDDYEDDFEEGDAEASGIKARSPAAAAGSSSASCPPFPVIEQSDFDAKELSELAAAVEGCMLVVLEVCRCGLLRFFL